MTSSDRHAAFLAAADQIEAWAAALPPRSPEGDEPWWLFLDRRFAAESALIARLRAAPHFQLEICPMREQVELHLGGLHIQTKQGLGAALRDWAALARERWSRAPGPETGPETGAGA